MLTTFAQRLLSAVFCQHDPLQDDAGTARGQHVLVCVPLRLRSGSVEPCVENRHRKDAPAMSTPTQAAQRYRAALMARLDVLADASGLGIQAIL